MLLRFNIFIQFRGFYMCLGQKALSHNTLRSLLSKQRIMKSYEVIFTKNDNFPNNKNKAKI